MREKGGEEKRQGKERKLVRLPATAQCRVNVVTSLASLPSGKASAS